MSGRRFPPRSVPTGCRARALPNIPPRAAGTARQIPLTPPLARATMPRSGGSYSAPPVKIIRGSYRSSSLKIVAYILMLIASAGAVMFACYLTVMAGVGLHDFNSDAFEHKLNEVERTGIVQTATQLMSVQVALLIATNVLWVAGVGIALWRARKR
jgi:hypothetical protein